MPSGEGLPLLLCLPFILRPAYDQVQVCLENVFVACTYIVIVLYHSPVPAKPIGMRSLYSSLRYCYLLLLHQCSITVEVALSLHTSFQVAATLSVSTALCIAAVCAL